MADCPGIYKLAEMKDGLLARLRLPTGQLTTAQAELIAMSAATHAAGIIDLTNRANLQIRGVNAAALPDLHAAWTAAKLAVEDPAHDRVRNILIDPLTGLVKEQHNCFNLAKELDEALAKFERRHHLSPKFSFILDGGGPSNIAALNHDIAARAQKASNGQTTFHISFAGQPVGASLSAPDLIKTICTWLDLLCTKFQAAPRRLKTLLKLHGLAAIKENLSISDQPSISEDAWPTKLTPLSGMVQQTAAQEKRAINLSLPNGRLQHFQLQGLAELASQYGQGDIHLTPWQSVILPHVKEEDISTVWEKAEALGLLTQEEEQNLQILSCAGSEGCIHGGFETKLTALKIREAIARTGFPAPTTIHLSACEKGCASREKSTILVMQRQREQEMRLYVNAAPDTDAPGKAVTRSELIPELKKLI